MRLGRGRKELAVFVLGMAGWLAGARAERFTGPWPIGELTRVPPHEWGAGANGVWEIRFEGLPYLGRTTRVFAYLGIPEDASPGHPVPGVLLLHGGGLHADPEWVSYWMERGYAAMSVELNGGGPGDPPETLPPLLNVDTVFGPFPEDDLRNGWVYHAVANAMMAHSVLAAQPGVDASRIGVNGGSWGGFLTCIVAGVDERVRAAAAVYGCGYLWENSYRNSTLADMDCRRLAEWRSLLDPAAYLPGISCPFLMQNGAQDPFFGPLSFQHSWDVAGGGRKSLAFRPRLNHGRFWSWPWTEVEVNLFLDHCLRDGPAPPKVRIVEAGESELTCAVESELPVEGVYFASSADLGAWSQREWTTRLLEVDPAEFHVTLPPERPLAFFVMAAVKNERGFKGYFSTPFQIRRGGDSPDSIVVTPPVARDGEWTLAGERPRGTPVVIEGTDDFCHWVRLMTNNAPGIEFEWRMGATLPGGYRFFRARSWETVR
jgi:dienelactone hydrolase